MEILRRAARERCSVTELAGHFDMTLAAVSKHVRVLDEAKLLSRVQEGRFHWRRFNPEALEPARSSIEEFRAFWDNQLDGLEQFLNDEPAGQRRAIKRRRGRR